MDNDKDMRSTEETENDILEAPKMDTLDALLFDSEDSSPEENQEDQIDFEAFMAEYRSLIGKNLAEAAEMTEIEPEEEPVSEEEQKKEYDEEYLRKAPKKQQPKKKAKKKEPKNEPEKMSEWDEDITLAPDGDGYFRVYIRVAVSPNFLSWVMGFGADVTVLSPKSVIDEVKALAESVLLSYR